MMAASFEAPSKLGTGQGELDPRRMKKPQGPQRKARCGALGYKDKDPSVRPLPKSGQEGGAPEKTTADPSSLRSS